jgi:hypothetical protein
MRNLNVPQNSVEARILDIGAMRLIITPKTHLRKLYLPKPEYNRVTCSVTCTMQTAAQTPTTLTANSATDSLPSLTPLTLSSLMVLTLLSLSAEGTDETNYGFTG